MVQRMVCRQMLAEKNVSFMSWGEATHQPCTGGAVGMAMGPVAVLHGLPKPHVRWGLSTPWPGQQHISNGPSRPAREV